MSDDLAGELRALRARDYAEEGIAMITGVETVGTPLLPGMGDADLAAAFRAVASDPAMAGIGPAGILELLAAREMGRSEPNR